MELCMEHHGGGMLLHSGSRSMVVVGALVMPCMEHYGHPPM